MLLTTFVQSLRDAEADAIFGLNSNDRTNTRNGYRFGVKGRAQGPSSAGQVERHRGQDEPVAVSPERSPRQMLQRTRSLPHGHVAAVFAQAQALGLPGLLGPAGRQRDLALALIVARVCKPASKLATTRWWADSTLARDLGVADASTDEVYGALDWLVGQQAASRPNSRAST